MPDSRLANLEYRMTAQYKLAIIPIILFHCNYILSAKVRFYSANIGLLPCAPVTWWWIWWDKKMNPLQVIGLQRIGVGGLAERQGFEPWVPVRVQRFSRPSRSTTPASFLGVLRRQNYKLFWTLQNSFAFFCHLIPIVVNNSLTACDILSPCRLRHFMNNDPIMAPDELPKASCSVAGLDIPNPMSLL